MATPEKLKEIKDEYSSSLSDLTINSKPLINMLTMLAEDNIDNANIIVQAVEEHLEKIRSEYKLPVLYLIDSIVKNVGNAYTQLFTQNIVGNFCSVFEKVDERIRSQMFKLRQTWSEVFPAKKMYALDVRVNAIDPAWPIIAPQPTSIHVNPKFFNKSANATMGAPSQAVYPAAVAATVPPEASLDMRAQLINKQKELLELQQKKIELELLQAKVKWEEQQKQYAKSQKSNRKASSNTVGSQPVAAITQPLVPPKATPNGPRIAPVNSALVAASARSAPRDPRLAAKLASVGATTNVDKSAKPSIEVSLDKPEKVKNSLTESSNKTSVNNKINLPNTALNTNIKDPRLISSKVHQSNLTAPNQYGGAETTPLVVGSSTKGKSGSIRDASGQSVASSRLKESGDSHKNNKRSRGLLSKSSVKSGQNDYVESKSKNNRESSKSRSSSRSPTKPLKRKDTSPRKKVTVTEAPASPPKRLEKRIPKLSKMYQPTTIVQSQSPLNEADDKNQIGNSVEDVKGFKDIKGLSKSRSYIRRNRANSHSPDLQPLEVSTTVQDVDLRTFGPPPEKQARVQSPTPVSSSAMNNDASATINVIPAMVPTVVPEIESNGKISEPIVEKLESSIKDVDLRQIPVVPSVSNAINRKRASTDQLEYSPSKKSKAEMIDVLFGNEDVDLRTLPPPQIAMNTETHPEQPPTPPPPVISSPSNFSESSWSSKTVETKLPSPTENIASPNTHLATCRAKLANATNRDRLGRPLLYDKLPDDPMERKRTISTSSKSDTDLRQQPTEKPLNLQASIEMYLNQVEEEKNLGKISKTQYQNAMEHVIALVERQKLRKAKRMEKQNESLNNDSSDKKQTVHTISDDELSGGSSTDEDTKKDVDEREKTAPPVIIDVDNEPEYVRSDSNSPPPKKNIGRKSKRWDNDDSRKPPFRAGQQWKPLNFPQQNVTNLSTGQRPNVVVGGLIKPPPIGRYDSPRAESPPPLGTISNRELPQADQTILEFINNDITRTINIDNKPTEIRFYNDVAVAMMNGDEPIEISFQNGKRRIICSDKETYMLSFNDEAREVLIGSKLHRVRLGAPTRELYIDDKWYECFFGGPGIVTEIDREYRVIKLDGPAPQVQFGKKRSDLCAGRINLIINAKNIVPVYLDAKPQKFDIEGKIHTLRFVDALKTVLINEEPFRVNFGGLPKPIIVNDRKHFIRFTRLPPGIRPGFVKIKDMEGQRGVSPPPIETENSMDRVIVISSGTDHGDQSSNPAFQTMDSNSFAQSLGKNDLRNKRIQNNFEKQPALPQNQTIPQQAPVFPANLLKSFNLDLLSSIINPVLPPASNINASGYNTNIKAPETDIPGFDVPQAAPVLPAQPSGNNLGSAPLHSFEDLKQLIKKLEATGIINNMSDTSKQDQSKHHHSNEKIKPVLFSQPETLKIKQGRVISNLYSGMQCSSCGVRFPPEHTIKYSRQHLDWHYRQNKKKKSSVRKANSRKWFYDVSDWIQYEEIEDLEEREKSWFENQQNANAEGAGATEEPVEEEEEPSVDARSAGENPRCDVCYDAFDQFYNEEKEEWHLRMAIKVDDKLYHPPCYEDYKLSLTNVSVVDEPQRVLDDTADDVKVIDEEIKMIEIDDDDEDDEAIILDDKPVEDNATEVIPVTEDDDSTKTSQDDSVVITTPNENSNGDDLDCSEQDVCIILPEEEIPIVKIDDTDDKEDEPDVFKVNDEESQSSQRSETKPRKMVDFVLLDGSVVQIKSEPSDELEEPEEVLSTEADTTHAAVLSSIDGNVQLEPAVNTTTVRSGGIKINISKPLNTASQSKDVGDTHSDTNSPLIGTCISSGIESSEPPPPGEEPAPIKLKPALQNITLKNMPLVQKGSELSGLCSIM